MILFFVFLFDFVVNLSNAKPRTMHVCLDDMQIYLSFTFIIRFASLLFLADAIMASTNEIHSTQIRKSTIISLSVALHLNFSLCQKSKYSATKNSGGLSATEAKRLHEAALQLTVISDWFSVAKGHNECSVGCRRTKQRQVRGSERERMEKKNERERGIHTFGRR